MLVLIIKKVFFELKDFLILYVFIIISISIMLLSANGNYIYPTLSNDHDDNSTKMDETETSEDYPTFNNLTKIIFATFRFSAGT